MAKKGKTIKNLMRFLTKKKSTSNSSTKKKGKTKPSQPIKQKMKKMISKMKTNRTTVASKIVKATKSKLPAKAVSEKPLPKLSKVKGKPVLQEVTVDSILSFNITSPPKKAILLAVPERLDMEKKKKMGSAKQRLKKGATNSESKETETLEEEELGYDDDEDYDYDEDEDEFVDDDDIDEDEDIDEGKSKSRDDEVEEEEEKEKFQY